ncbi:MAG: DUF929 family protein [Candidatus Dormibacteria bacterium]
MPRPSKRRREELSAGTVTRPRTADGTRPTPSTPRPRTPEGTRPTPSTPSRYRTQRVEAPRPWWQDPRAWGSGVTFVVVVVVVVFIILGTRPAAKGTSPSSADLVPASVLSAVIGVSPTVSTSIGAGGVTDPLEAISGSPSALTGSDGKPEVFYAGAEYCPYCAAERWSLVVALSRFGSFSDLHTTTSSSTDVYPNTDTFSFYGSSYSSSYLDFVPVETADHSGNPLQTPSAAEETLVTTYDTSPYSATYGGIPFQDFGNRYVVSGTGVPPQVLQGMSWAQIAATLTDPTSKVAQPIIGNANWLTAGICKLTGDQPGSVCSAAPIASLESELGSS